MSLLKTNEIQNYNGSSLTLTASTVSTSAQLNTGGNISVTGSLNVSDDSTTRTNLGLGTIATQDSDSITVSGGTATLGALTVSGSDSGDLVRITQTGSGNALVVEDSTNPDSTPFVVDASGNVGIGSSPSYPFQVGSSDLIIDSSGNLLVGTTDTNPVNNSDGSTGVAIKPTGEFLIASNQNTVCYMNRQGTDGDIQVFRKDGSTVGSIGNAGVNVYVSGASGKSGITFGTLSWQPMYSGSVADNAIDLGGSSVRFDDIYATNGTIQTSDQNEKQDIEELTEAEQRVAVAAKSLMRKFRWKSAVAKKGDEARIHFGIIAQDLQAAFEAEGLDAGRYAMFISSTWWEATETYTDDDGVEQTRTNTYDTAEEAPEGAVERTQLGVRYSELLAFIIAAI